MAKFQSSLNRIASQRDRVALRQILSQFLTDDDPPKFKSMTFGASALPINLTGAFTTGITIAADGTTAISVTSAFSGVTGISLAGTASVAGINISGNHTTAITIGAQTTAGLAITGATATGISITGACSTAALSIVQSTAITTGVKNSLVLAQTHTGAGASAEALSATLNANVICGTYINALFGKIDLKTAGGVTGLAGVICGELTMPGGAIAGAVGTYSVFEAEINCPTAYAGTVPIHVFQINAWGAEVGKFDDYGYLFDLTGVSSGADHIWYDNQKAAPAVEEFIRVKTPAGVRYLGLYNANA